MDLFDISAIAAAIPGMDHFHQLGHLVITFGCKVIMQNFQKSRAMPRIKRAYARQV
jgi:hypothetical protein